MPKGGASSLTPVYAGLCEDIDSFLKAFLRTGSRRFSDYKNLFAHRGVINIFNGRSHSAEIIEFNERLLVSCLPYMEENVCEGSPRSLEERLFGLYSLYTFFYLQSVGLVVKIRMDPDAVRTFTKFADFLLKEQILDAYFCCLKLLESNAFKIVAFISTFDPSCFKRFGIDSTDVKGVPTLTNVNDPLGNVKALIETPTFKKLGLVHNLYMKKKEELGVRCGGIQLANVQALARGIVEKSTWKADASYKAHQNWDPCLARRSGRQLTRAEIKEKAYGAGLQLARDRRHRACSPLKMKTEVFEFRKEVVKYTKPAVKDENDQVKIEEKQETPLKKRRKKGKNGPGRPRKQPLKSEKKEKIKKQRIPSAPTTVIIKPTGRKTNNSVSSELFAVAEIKMEIKKDIKQEVLSVAEIKVEPPSEDDDEGKEVQMEVDECDTPPNLKMDRKSVTFRENDLGEDIVSICTISPRNTVSDEEMESEDNDYVAEPKHEPPTVSEEEESMFQPIEDEEDFVGNEHSFCIDLDEN
ncbi:unnamed protein product [Caenorhabditis sp. 36 PRJEB53466]|nr:unnamed protein product [Caenorhabditis sp. 36 PRJEB53466]